MSKTYIAAYDGSPAGRRAVDLAVDLAKAGGADLIIAHILEWSPYSFLTPEEIEERHGRRHLEIERAETSIVGPLVAELAGEGLNVTSVVKFGHVADTICSIASEVGAAQIFIGRTGHTSVVQRFFGSVAGSLTQMAPVPCTIVP